MSCCATAVAPELHTYTIECDNPKGTILLVHGLGEHSGRWQHVAEFFSQNGYRFVAYDLRGHGRSGGKRLDLRDFDDHLADLQSMVEKVRETAGPLFIYGHSMGGLIATRYAESDRPQPEGYILSAPALEANVPGWQRVAARVLGTLLPCVRVSAAITGDMLSSDPEVGRAYFADPLVYLKGTARHGKKVLAAMEVTRKHVLAIRRPTLVIHGDADTLVPVDASARLEMAKDVERVVFKGLRHEPHNEPDKEQVLAIVLEWLDRTVAEARVRN